MQTKDPSRNSVKSIASYQNKLTTMSSKCLLSTMNSNQQLISDVSQHHNHLRSKNLPDINKIYFTSLESNDLKENS